MKVTTEQTKAAWRSRVKAGSTKPFARVTMQDVSMRLTPYNTDDAPGGDYDVERSRTGHFANLLFGQGAGIRELRNVRRVSWARSVDQDIAECTITVLNTEVVPIGNLTETSPDDFELPGLFTFSRGSQTASANRWGYDTETGWNTILAPDRLVKTYEGYGVDFDEHPGDDPHQYQSGTWLVDDVDYNSDGDIEIKLRDVGRLLIDAIAFPPIIPLDDYPLSWWEIHSEEVEARDVAGGKWGTPKATTTSSNNLYVGTGVVDRPRYVSPNGNVNGHSSRDAITGDASTYWASTGQDDPDDFVWWQETLAADTTVSAVRLHTFGGPYRAYISLQHEDGTWYGKKKVPYTVTTGGVDIGADIPFVSTIIAERGQPFEVVLKRKYRNVKKVRITLTDLRKNGPAQNYVWRGNLRTVALYTGSFADMSFTKGTVLKPVGNYKDFTDIVKWCLSWAGLWWPEDDQENWIKYSSAGDHIHYTYATHDHALPKGRAWGSFQDTGTAGLAKLMPDNFDKQPLLDCITYVRNITGFSFWFDEVGGAIWRMPNLYELGNYISLGHKFPRRAPMRTSEIVTIDENETLLSYSTTLSSKNLRERIFVGDSTGKYGIAIAGYQPYKVGFRRVAGWTDENFESNREAIVAADMIAARQMFEWRRAKVTTWGNPALQIDDQVRIFERVTNETFYHYVLGVSSELDNEGGTWTYTLDTHWLGEEPEDAWVVRVDQLNTLTQQYLSTLGPVD